MTAGLSAADPTALGPYRLLGRLGGGGMGQVYLGKSPGGRLVAVKVIRPEYTADPEFRTRFAREVANAKNVNGMFTAVVADADTHGPVPWLATAYIPGPSLDAAVHENGPLPLASLLPLAAGLAEALSAIHAAGVVHRDLKPSNVLLAADGPRVIDFGISYAAEASRVTQTGSAVGSPGYMSPEQAQGLPVGPASDVFSLGAVLTFAATGAGPFGDGTVQSLLYRVVHEPPLLDGMPPELRPLVQRCLAKDPAARPSPGEMLAELGGEPIQEDWLPQAVASTLARYEPSAQVAALAAGEPGTGERTATSVPASATHTGPARPRHRGRRQASTAGSGRRGRVVTAAVAAAVAAVLAAGFVIGTTAFRGRGPGSASAPPASPLTSSPSSPSPPGDGTDISPTPTASVTQTSATVSVSPSVSVSPPVQSSSPPTVTPPATSGAFPCTDTVQGSANVGGAATTNAGVGIYAAPAVTQVDTSPLLETVYTGQPVTGTCDFYAQSATTKWYMQVHMGNGGYGYIWIQYLAVGWGHQCRDNGVIVKMTNTSSATKLPATFTNGSAACSLRPLDEATVSS